MDKKVWSSCENHLCFFRGAQKRAISAVVATVLIILITVAGVGIIWVGVLPMINRGFEFSGLDGRVSVLSSGGYTVYDSSRGIASVQVKRDVDEGVMNRIKISFVVDGSSVSSSVVAPDSGQTKVYSFDLSSVGEPDSVEVAPIFVAESGREKEGDVTSKVDLPSGVLSEVDVVVYEVGRDYFYEMSTDGLVSWWKFDNVSGSVVEDCVGGNDGVNNNAEFIDDVERGGVLDFEGVDYVEIPVAVFSEVEKEISISLWQYGDVSIQPQADTIFEGRDADNYRVLNVHLPWSNSNVYWDAGNSYDRINKLVDTDDFEGRWNHWAFTKNVDTGIMEIYINGKLWHSGTGKTRRITGITTFKIGSRYDGISYNYDGAIDDFMIFNRALSGEEVVAIYEVQKKD